MGKMKDLAIDELNKQKENGMNDPNKDSDKQDMICELTECVISQDKRPIGPCKWAIRGSDGKQNCGYG